MTNYTYYLSIPCKGVRPLRSEDQEIVVDYEISFDSNVLHAPEDAMKFALDQVKNQSLTFSVKRVRFGNVNVKKHPLNSLIDDFVEYKQFFPVSMDLVAHPWRCAIIVHNSDVPVREMISDDVSSRSLFQTLGRCDDLRDWSPFAF